MPQGIPLRDPIPAWMKSENASVFDSALTKAMRLIAQKLGADDPMTYLLGVLTTEVPSAGELGGMAGALQRLMKKAEPLKPIHQQAPEVKAEIDQLLPEYFHGSPADIYGSPSGHFEARVGESGQPAVWGTTDWTSAEGYSRGEIALTPDQHGKFPLVQSYYKDYSGNGGVYAVRSGAKNPKIVDAGGKRWIDVPQSTIMAEARAAGHDAVVFKNIADNYQSGGPTSDVIAWFDPRAIIKSGDQPLSDVERSVSRYVNPSIKVYHGSPHDYAAERLIRHPSGVEEYIVGAPDVLPDVPPGATVLKDFPLGRARMDKIGTGEGAQAYAHGLYGAENPGVAGSYRELAFVTDAEQRSIIDALPQGFKGPDNARGVIANIRKAVDNGDITKPSEFASVYDVGPMQAAYETAGKLLDNKGKMYEWAIHADPETFLDWDKPLSQQSEAVRKAITSLAGDVPEVVEALPSATGESITRQLLPMTRGFGGRDPDLLADELRRVGIPGIKYLDQGSRNVQLIPPSETVHGQWLVKQIPNGNVLYRGPSEEAAKQAYAGLTRNYVVFDDSLIEILKKYGFLPPAAGALNQWAQPQPQMPQPPPMVPQMPVQPQQVY